MEKELILSNIFDAILGPLTPYSTHIHGSAGLPYRGATHSLLVLPAGRVY